MSRKWVKDTYIITRADYAALLGEAYSETLALDVLENPANAEWFDRIDDVIQYVLYNYANIEVEETNVDIKL